MAFAWIEERRSEFPVAVMCRVLGVSRAGYYAWRTRPPSDTARHRDQLADAIRAVHAEPHLGTYGSPRMARELNARGVACCVNTVAKVIRAMGLRARTTRRFVRTTDSKPRWPVSDNVRDREFTASKPNEKWAMDWTDIPTHEGWLFLALVVDLFSRRIVGWARDATMTSRLVVDALVMVVVAGVIAHSDRGSQYASDHSQAELARHPMVESTFGRMKVELTHGQRYATRDEAKASILESIEVFYNHLRRHSTLGDCTPDEFERTQNPKTR